MTDERTIAYLLAELPEADLERFEEECFSQESWPDQIDMVEGDLIDAYLRDELAPERRPRFERYFLTTPARQERVIMAAALLRHVDELHALRPVAAPEPPTRTTTQIKWSERFRASWIVAAAAAAVIVIALWLGFFRAPPPRTVATLTLTMSDSTRGPGAHPGTIKLQSDVESLRVSLVLPPQVPAGGRFRVELENEGGERLPANPAGQDGVSVQAVIPASKLTRGQYALKLIAIESDGSERRLPGTYLFIVE